jgi:RHS repeat-associated protein
MAKASSFVAPIGNASSVARLPLSGGLGGRPDVSGSLPSITLPRGGGAVRGLDETLSVGAATGAATLSVPIATPPGRSGFGPSLALTYGTGAGNGPFGLGWDLSQPLVTRRTSKGLPRYEDAIDNDVFLLSGSDELVPMLEPDGHGGWTDVSGPDPSGQFTVRRYRPRDESGFARIERWLEIATGDVHWRVTTAQNVTSVYGDDDVSRVSDPADAHHVFSWLLTRSYDAFGNVLACEYKAEDTANVPDAAYEQRRSVTANRYLKRVRYGNVGPYLPASDPALPDAWHFEVVFDYGEHDPADPSPVESVPWACRPDPFSSYRSGFEIRTYRRCQRILVFHRFPDELPRDAVLVRSTDLTYSTDDAVDPSLPVISLLASVTGRGYRLDAHGSYESRAFPPIGLGYSHVAVHAEVATASREALAELPVGVDGRRWRWTDLDGSGLPGVLSEDDAAWYYHRNISAFNPAEDGPAARFEPVTVVAAKPVMAPAGQSTELLDLHGDGVLCAVDFTPGVAGYYARDGRGWAPFVPLTEAANLDLADPNLRHIDVDGDGLSDLLFTDDGAFSWYPWLESDQIGPADRVINSRDEDAGPALVFADGEGSVLVADMSGDGLADLVRVRNGEVCYWPNLGFARFGPKVVMDGAPWFEAPDQFDPRRLRLADIDGSGTSDVIYLGSSATTLWFNQSGNSWSAPVVLSQLPAIDDTSAVATVDLLGTGTSCLVWSSPLPSELGRQLRYVDLMGGTKPHLLTSIVNNTGAESTITYSTSTQYRVEDHLAGIEWLTPLAFPVYVVAQVEAVDRVAGTRTASAYRYRHGFFDPVDREFRGFAMVEQTDTDAIPAASGIGTFSDVPPVDGDEFTLLPVVTRSWFHTGTYVDGVDLADVLREDFWSGDPAAARLDGAQLDGMEDPEDQLEACRALRGHLLRTELFVDDGAPNAVPYLTSDHRYGVRRLQPASGTSHGSALAYEVESITHHYEQDGADPRLTHTLCLEVDPHGTVTRSAQVSYPRRVPGFTEQGATFITYDQHDVVDVVDQDAWYRLAVPVESRTYEITGLGPPPGHLLFDPVLLATSSAAAATLAYDEQPDGSPQKRLLTRSRSIYLADDLSGPLPVGTVESLALVHQSYGLVMTKGLVTGVLAPVISEADALALATGAGGALVDLDGDGNWWQPSARSFYSPDPAHPDAAFARAHFYLAQGSIDVFGSVETVTRAYDLVTIGSTDAVGNTTEAEINYRTLASWLVTDANGNRTGARFDELGLVVAEATMGKLLQEGTDEADHLDLTTDEPSPSDDPSSTLEYDLHAYRLWADDPHHDPDRPQPIWSHTRRRVRHKDPATPWLETYVYADGTGRVALTKPQAEPGNAPERGPDGELMRAKDGSLVFGPATTRWVGSGRMVYDNKGNVVKSYEPFFDSSPTFDVEADLAAWGVTSIARYDPLGRLIRKDNPDGTFRSVTFGAWRHSDSDEVDDVLASTWYAARAGGGLGADQQDAATKAAALAGTPAVSDLDSAGRVFRTLVDGPAGVLETRLVLDITGKVRATIDALGRTLSSTDYDVGGTPIHTSNLDSGEHWTIADAAGQPLQTWDSRGSRMRRTFDALHRPLDTFLSDHGGPERMAESVEYGEGQVGDVARNLRGSAWAHRDGAGVVTTDSRDFAGRVTSVTRQLVEDPAVEVDWGAGPAMGAEKLTVTTSYDALGRALESTTPDGSVAHSTFNERSLVSGMAIDVRGAHPSTTYVEAVDYDAKGQRRSIAFGNGATSTYSYDPDTFRLIRMVTERTQAGSPVQDLSYTYDPVGNITRIADAAQSTVFFANQLVAPIADYTYDVAYRLLVATGREHIGQATPHATSWDDTPARSVPLPTDLQAMRNYIETYVYDLVGNILSVAHAAAGGSWTRTYNYDGSHVPARTNRLTSTRVGAVTEVYSYDAHGNVVATPHLSLMTWDHKDQLRATATQVVNVGDPETTWYGYDAAGRRVRKATVSGNGVLERERLNVGGYEVYREYAADGSVTVERQTLPVADGVGRIALIETTAIDAAKPLKPPLTTQRYQFGNHVGSACVELDENGAVITYEEFYPYGATSLLSGRSVAEVSLKRYRFTGKERDDENGLNYHGARYYAPWLGRWMSPDPEGLADGPCVYAYCGGNPVVYQDPSGTESKRYQMWFSQAPPYRQPVTATRAGRGISPRDRLNARKGAQMWGQPGPVDVGHLDKSFAHTPAGQTTNTVPHERGPNRAQGATTEKAETALRRQQGKFTRNTKGIDTSAKKRVRNPSNPEAPGYASKEFKEWKPAQQPPKPTAPALAPTGPSGTVHEPEQLNLFDYGKPKVETPKAPLVSGGGQGSLVTTEVKEGVEAAFKTEGKGVLKEAGKFFGEKVLKWVPVVGSGVGLGLVAYDLKHGDYWSAALDAAEAVPVVGDVVGAGHMGITAGTAASEALGIPKIAAEDGAAVERAAKWFGIPDDAATYVGATGAAVSAISVAPFIAIGRPVSDLIREAQVSTTTHR